MRGVTASLSDCIERIESERKTLRVCNAPDGADLERVESFFDPHDLEVIETAARPDDVVDLLARMDHLD